MSASNYTETNILNTLLRGVTFPATGRVYVGLHTADPTDAGGSEVTTGNWPAYVRRDPSNGGAVASGWTDPASTGQSTNTLQIVYPGMNGASNVTVSHFAIYDAATNGNMVLHGALQTSRILQPGDVLVFDIGSLTVTMD